MELPGYECVELLGTSTEAMLLRARSSADGAAVVIKLRTAEPATAEDIARCDREFRIGRELNAEGVVRPRAVEYFGHRVGLVMEDFGGVSLKSLIGEAGLAIEDFLHVAEPLACSLARVHAADVVHRDLNPSNVVVDPTLRTVKIIDFGIATRLGGSAAAGTIVERAEGTFAYMAPEQTGRINRGMDHRADLYSLGATYYEMLTGRPPFAGSDPLELVHGHLAVRPQPPGELAKVPAALSALVMRLLEKEPDARYQSAEGVVHDLQAIGEAHRRGADPADFKLGRADVVRHFAVPDRVYGRQREFAALQQAFEAAADGTSALVLVSGPSGVGKSALARELAQLTATRRGYFIDGKFDQYSGGVPYSSLVAAFRGLIGRLLGEPPDRVEEWRGAIDGALEANAAVVAAVLPEIRLLIGETGTAAEVGPIEAQNRLTLSFRRFVSVFGRPGHPLVIFLDDLQWADTASLRMLRSLLTDPEDRHLLLVGAFRPDEVDISHPLTLLISSLDADTVVRVEVGPLTGGDVAELVADTLRRPPDEVATLAALVHERTAGNPFFVGQFLLSLHSDALIRFAADVGGWVWDLAAIRDRGITDNVADLVTERVSGLSPPTIETLGIAALIGNRFDLGVLTAVQDASPQATARLLEEARQVGLLLALGDGHEQVMETGSAPDLRSVEYRFAHDRVQQACFALLPADTVPGLRRRAGRVLLTRLQPQRYGAELFAVLDQLNPGLSAITEPAELRELARLNLEAARRARSATAYESAAAYLAIAITALGPDGWTDDYDVSFQLHLQQAHVSAVLGLLTEAEAMFAVVLRRARTATDKALACDVQSEAVHGAGRAHDAYLLGRAGLEHLGEVFPETPEETAAEVDRLVSGLLVPDVPARFLGMAAGDAEAEVAGRLFWRAMIGAYYSQPLDLPLVVGRSVESALRRGYTKDTGLALGFLGMIAVMQGRHPQGVAFAEAALAIGERADDPFARARTNLVAWILSLVWSQPFDASEAALDRTAGEAYQVGDLEFVNHAMIGAYISSLMAGRNCGHILERCERWEEFCRTLAPLEHGQARIRSAALRRLMGRDAGDVDAEAVIAAYENDRDLTDVCESLMELARVENLFGNYRAAYTYSVRAEPHVVAGAAGTLLLTLLFRVHYAIACAQLHTGQQNAGHLAKVDDLLSWLEPLAEFNPENFASYVDLVRAERARAAGDAELATTLYLRSIAHAGAHRYVLLEAQATELLGRHFHARSLRFAAAFLAEARALYAQCGATAKAAALAAELPPPPVTRPRSTDSFGTSTTDSVGGRLDLATALKAALAIAGEIAIDRVVARLIAISIENAGATRGVFVSATGDRLQVTAEGLAGGEVTEQTAWLDELVQAVPVGLIRTAARTAEPIVLTDGLSDPRLAGDPYLAANCPRSVLVLPVVRTGQVEGVLYLENSLVAGAFTPERLGLLEVLSGQMAISLENARLYAHLEEMVAERTRALSDALEDLRVAQHQVIEAEKLAALGGLVAGVAHEINTPVGIAVTAMSNLADRAAEFRTMFGDGTMKRSSLERFIETVEDSSQLVLTHLRRSADLVESFKQVAVDQSSEELRTIEMRDYLEDIVRSLRPRLKPTSHLVEVEAAPRLTVCTYPGAIAQVVTNLVLNSLTHAYDPEVGGRITLAATARPHGVRVVYRDDGRGIDAGIAARVFEPFFTTQRTRGGSGLGLHIVYNLVTQRLGGTVTLDGRPGKGAEFTIDLPNLEPEPGDG